MKLTKRSKADKIPMAPSSGQHPLSKFYAKHIILYNTTLQPNSSTQFYKINTILNSTSFNVTQQLVPIKSSPRVQDQCPEGWSAR